MPIELKLSLGTLYGFLLVLARISGVLSFVPIPGFTAAASVVRVVLAFGLTLVLAPLWPKVNLPESGGGGLFAMWILAEAAFGVTVGLAVMFLNEAFVISSQIFGLQAGYGYAATVDPATRADSSVLQIVTHLTAGLLFFAFGMDRQIIRIFAESLTTQPPGTFLLTPFSANYVLKLGSTMFSTAVRFALPVVALLMMVDLSLALLGRINAQLQLLTLAFPAKMLVSMLILATIAVTLPVLYRSAADPTLRVLRQVLLSAH